MSATGNVDRALVPGGSRAAPLLIALVAAVVAPLLAIFIEAKLNLGQDWISDAILSPAVLASTYLWLNLRATRSRLSSLERAQIALDSQLALAAQIQRNLLPPAPLPRAGCRWAAFMRPAGRVGGDLYDFVETDSSVVFFLGDVSGKGIPAALLMTATRAFFRTITRETVEPAEIVRRLSRALFEENRGTPYVTCVVARVDLRDRLLTHVNAGHPPSLLDDGRTTRSLAVGGPPAGLFPDSRFETESLRLPSGAVLVAVTDGITEGIESTGSSLEAAVRSLRAEGGAPPAAERIGAFLMERSVHRPGSLAPPDDRTIVALAVGEEPPA